MLLGSVLTVLALASSCGMLFIQAYDPGRVPRPPSPPATDPRTSPAMTRRAWGQWWAGPALATLVVAGSPPAAGARDELFRPNPLTNPLLEQIRIWDQEQADHIKYGGELERGDAGNKGRVSAYPRLLVPILQMAAELDRIQTWLVLDRPSDTDPKPTWKEARAILSQPKYDKLAFKTIFNAYGDNIYYSDPDRANLYLGGGATPRTEQSLAYLQRNEILTHVEALQAELDYLLQHPDESTDDLVMYAQNAHQAMQQYLALCSPTELEKARELLAASN